MVGCTNCPWSGPVYALKTYALLTSTVQGCPVCGGTVRTVERAVPRCEVQVFTDTVEAAETIVHRLVQQGPPHATGRARWQITGDSSAGELVEVPDDAPC